MAQVDIVTKVRRGSNDGEEHSPACVQRYQDRADTFVRR